MQTYKILTLGESLEYLESIKDTMSKGVYESMKEGLPIFKANNKQTTKKWIDNAIECRTLDEQGKHKEARTKRTDYAVENANLWLKSEGLIS